MHLCTKPCGLQLLGETSLFFHTGKKGSHLLSLVSQMERAKLPLTVLVLQEMEQMEKSLLQLLG